MCIRASLPRWNVRIISGVVVLALLSGLTWTNYMFAVQNPGGTDFLVHWMGTRAFLGGESPYDDAVALRIQNMIYGRPALPGEHEFRVAYPLYSAFLFTPFALVSDYTLARALWMTFLETGLLLLTYFSLRVTGWRIRTWLLLPLVLFSLLWYHALRQVINGNVVIWVAVLMVMVVWALQKGHDGLVGLFLAMATIKPHLVAVPLLFVSLWAISQRRWRILLSLILCLAGLVLAGIIFIPDWPLQNLREILRYTSYNPPTTPAAALNAMFPGGGLWLGVTLSVAIILILVCEWMLCWRKDFPRFLWTFCLTLTAGQWIGITTDPGNFILLFLPLVMILSQVDQKSRHGSWLVFGCLMVLFAGLWLLFLETVSLSGMHEQHPVMFFPLPLLLLIGLYAVRKQFASKVDTLSAHWKFP